jgi:hypothetical protein
MVEETETLWRRLGLVNSLPFFYWSSLLRAFLTEFSPCHPNAHIERTPRISPSIRPFQSGCLAVNRIRMFEKFLWLARPSSRRISSARTLSREAILSTTISTLASSSK